MRIWRHIVEGGKSCLPPVVASSAIVGAKVIGHVSPAGAATFPGNSLSYYLYNETPSVITSEGCYETARSISGVTNVVLKLS
jgi:hypothetical protein